MSRKADTTLLRARVFDRAKGRCEAGDRCPYPPTDLHHVMPRARARHGEEHILDRWGAAQIRAGVDVPLLWLKAVCDRCHRLAHGNPLWAMSIGLTLPGDVRTGLDGAPVYTGPHNRLSELLEVPADEEHAGTSGEVVA